MDTRIAKPQPTLTEYQMTISNFLRTMFKVGLHPTVIFSRIEYVYKYRPYNVNEV